MDHRVELAEAIEAIREELADAAERGAGQPVQFEVGPVNLEFTVELKRDARAKGGVKAWVLSGDLEAGLVHGRTHKVSVTLTPRLNGGGSVLVGNPESGDAGGFAVER